MGLTRNGRKIFGALLSNRTQTSSGSYSNVGYGDLKLVNSNGETAKDFFNNTNAYPSILFGYETTSRNVDINYNDMDADSSYNHSRIGICFGKGTEKETLDDYTLTSLENNPKCKSLQVLRADASFIMQVISTVTNPTNENITINEIGIGLWGYGKTGLTSNRWKEQVLIFRRVLENPVTILPDESYTFAISLK